MHLTLITGEVGDILPDPLVSNLDLFWGDLPDYRQWPVKRVFGFELCMIVPDRAVKDFQIHSLVRVVSDHADKFPCR